ncbi:hypothetical protein E4U17_003814 [Claviceps sp. LM77 group G4]|nr:hypothetical protein E4U17_003814 [Claviceps sp. LM77 group G4]KAG6075498.1 hypothetical protein E4U33_002062 [Claviceps sp. LM78 group G4]KAG6083999.1 hypothetical protein E4U16_002819 [Claviceps sp. LM84 group G4]
MPVRKTSAPEKQSTIRRRSGRLSTSAQKSSYFEDPHDSDESEPAAKKRRKATFERETKHEEESEDRYEESADEARHDDEQDDDNDGNEEGEDDDDDDDAPRKVVILPLEKLRDTGDVDYADHKVHRNTLLFLKDLKANNRRAWLKSHDGEYRRALKDWQTFVEIATQTVIDVDETVPELPFKDVFFRIYRDIRFSKIKTPYKPHFSAAWSRTGRKGPYACYYIHCEPGSSFIGGGLWQPQASSIAKLRRSIDRYPDRWRHSLNETSFKKTFFPKIKANAGPDAVVKAFAERNKENALKKRPMGYEITHRDIELLKLRNYTIGTKIDADFFTKDDVQERLADLIRGLCGFVTFLNSIVLPDPGMGDEDDENGSGGDEDGAEA